jgi:hypothetical protein
MKDTTWWFKQGSIIIFICGILTTGLLAVPVLVSDGLVSALPSVIAGAVLLLLGGVGWRRYRTRESVDELERVIFR